MKKFIGNFAGEDIILDGVDDAAAIALIKYLQSALVTIKSHKSEFCAKCGGDDDGIDMCALVLQHESDIANGIDDWGRCKELFKKVFGRQPKRAGDNPPFPRVP